MTVFGYLLLISIEYYDFIACSVFSLVLVSIETVLDHISIHLETQKYSATRRIFNTLLVVLKCGQTRSYVFDILHTPLLQLGRSFE